MTRVIRQLIGPCACCMSALVSVGNAKPLLVAVGGPAGRVESYDESGALIGILAEPGGFIADVAVNPLGDVYVTAGGPGTTVRRYTSEGMPLFPPIYDFPADYWPMGLAFDAAGRLYLGLNSGIDRIFRYSSLGALLGNFADVPDRGAGAPFDLEFDSTGRLYVPNYEGGIDRFDADGNWLGTFATHPGGPVVDMAFDRQGNLYALSFTSDRIVKFNSQGNLLGTVVQGIGNLRALAFDDNDVLFVGGWTGLDVGFVKKYLPDGAFIGDFSTNMGGAVRVLTFGAAIPEPSSDVLMFLGLSLTLVHTAKRPRRRRIAGRH